MEVLSNQTSEGTLQSEPGVVAHQTPGPSLVSWPVVASKPILAQTKGERKMETIKVFVGSVVSGNAGQTNDTTRAVEFEGEELASYHAYGYKDSGAVDDTRGEKQTLYRASDGRLIVHVKDWSHWQGEPTTYTLFEVSADDLGPNGAFELLGLEAGMGRPLTLDEALTPMDSYDDE